MYSTPTLAIHFARNTRVVRADQPLSEDQIRRAAPSIFAEGKHASRSERYTLLDRRIRAVISWCAGVGRSCVNDADSVDRPLSAQACTPRSVFHDPWVQPRFMRVRVNHFNSEITPLPTRGIADLPFDGKAWAGIEQAEPVRMNFDSPKHSSA